MLAVGRVSNVGPSERYAAHRHREFKKMQTFVEGDVVFQEDTVGDAFRHHRRTLRPGAAANLWPRSREDSISGTRPVA